jgi:hypothetical protein
MKEGADNILSKLGGESGVPMTDPMAGFPSVENGFTAASPPLMMSAVPDEQGNLDSVVTAPRERKMSFLAKLADGVGAAYGQEPKFRQAFEKKQFQDAMEGFTDDPLTAIKRVARRDPATAWKMYGQYMDDTRQGDVAEQQRKTNALRYQGIGLDRIAGMAGAANEGNWSKMGPLLKKYAADKGLDVEIPDQWDPDIVNMIRYGGIKPDQQIDNERDDRRLDDNINYHNERLEDFDDNREAGTQQNADRIAAADERARLQRDAVEGRYQTGRTDKKNKSAGGYVTKVIRDSQGNDRRIVFTPDGKRAMGKVGDRTVWYTVKNGQLIPDKE